MLNRLKNPLCLLLSLFSFVTFAKVDNLDSLQKQLSSHALVRGQFTQLRHLQMFAQPLTSQGQFVLDKQHGLLWQQTAPFPVNLVLTQDKLRQSIAGQAPEVITSAQNPMAFYFSRIFLAVFHGDTNALQNEFDLSLSTDDAKWTLTLAPKSAPLNSVFEHIVLQGEDEIEQIELLEKRGDRSEIYFQAHSHQPTQLTSTEQQQFAF